MIKAYDTQRQEMIDITLQIEKLIAQGVSANRIGVIYRENKYGDELIQYLKLRKIPFYSKRSINILEIPLAQKIILLLKYISAERELPYSGDEMLFEILHFDWFHIPSIDIAKLSIEASHKKYDNAGASLRRLLFDRATAPPKDLFSQGLNENLKKACFILEQLIADVPNVTLQTLFENIIRKAGIVSHIMQSPQKIWLLQVLTGVFDFIKAETARNPFMGLKELVDVVDLMNKEDLGLPLIEICGNEKGVNVMTAHGSKGLEFTYVFLRDATRLFGKRNGSLSAVTGCQIQCCRQFPPRLARATWKNFAVYFMWLLPGQNSTLLFLFVASKMTEGN